MSAPGSCSTNERGRVGWRSATGFACYSDHMRETHDNVLMVFSYSITLDHVAIKKIGC